MSQESVYAATARPGTAVLVDSADRVRWGPVIAGLFAAMSSLIVLSVLGLAIGLSSVDAGDRPASFGVGAGIWGGVSALIAFFVGGYLAVRASGGRSGTGLLQGSMVWIVATPLLLWVVAGGIGSAAKAVGGAAAAGVRAAGSAAADPQVRGEVKAATQEAGPDVKQKVEQKVDEVRQQVTPERIEQAAGKAGGAAWGTLFSLLLGLAASAGGGYLGARRARQASTLA